MTPKRHSLFFKSVQISWKHCFKPWENSPDCWDHSSKMEACSKPWKLTSLKRWEHTSKPWEYSSNAGSIPPNPGSIAQTLGAYLQTLGVQLLTLGAQLQILVLLLLGGFTRKTHSLCHRKGTFGVTIVSTFSVHYQSTTKYRFGRLATDWNLLYETCVIIECTLVCHFQLGNVSVLFPRLYCNHKLYCTHGLGKPLITWGKVSGDFSRNKIQYNKKMFGLQINKTTPSIQN